MRGALEARQMFTIHTYIIISYDGERRNPASASMRIDRLDVLGHRRHQTSEGQPFWRRWWCFFPQTMRRAARSVGRNRIVGDGAEALLPCAGEAVDAMRGTPLAASRLHRRIPFRSIQALHPYTQQTQLSVPTLAAPSTLMAAVLDASNSTNSADDSSSRAARSSRRKDRSRHL